MIAHNKYKTYIHAYNQSKLFSDDDTYLKSSSTKSEKKTLVKYSTISQYVNPASVLFSLQDGFA